MDNWATRLKKDIAVCLNSQSLGSAAAASQADWEERRKKALEKRQQEMQEGARAALQKSEQDKKREHVCPSSLLTCGHSACLLVLSRWVT